MPVSKTQIDRLGDRLKGGLHTESDLRLLDGYRRSFGQAYEAVLRTIRQRGEFPTGRPAKSTVSIVEKLRRESLRLSQMQDIAGCRVVVADVVKQDQFIASLKTDFPGASVIDRRDNPSYGYRAVHIIAEISGKPVEIQVRTSLQHLWADVSEKSSDVLDPAIKYGGGPDKWRDFLTISSELVADYEANENHVAELRERLEPDHEVQETKGNWDYLTRGMVRLKQDSEEARGKMVRFKQDIEEWRGRIVCQRNRIADLLRGASLGWTRDG